MNKKDTVIDVEYESKECVEYEVTYYTCSQVSQLLDVSEKKIRTWVRYFQSIMHVPTENLIKRYTTTNIKQLAFIKQLIEEGLDLKEVMDHCTKHGFQMNNEIILNSITANKKELQALEHRESSRADEVMALLQNSLVEQQKMFEMVVNNMQEGFQKMQENDDALNEKIKNTQLELESNIINANKNLQENVEEMLDNKLQSQTNDINAGFKDLQEEIAVTQIDNEKIERLYKLMEERKESNTKEKPKHGLLDYLFRRKNR